MERMGRDFRIVKDYRYRKLSSYESSPENLSVLLDNLTDSLAHLPLSNHEPDPVQEDCW